MRCGVIFSKARPASATAAAQRTSRKSGQEAERSSAQSGASSPATKSIGRSAAALGRELARRATVDRPAPKRAAADRISHGDGGSSPTNTETVPATRPRRVRRRALILRELATMTSAGTALPAALQTLASALGGADGRTLARAARQLADGAPLSEVLVDGAGFEAVEGALLITAERTGRLPELLGQLADRAEALAEVRSRVLASLAWPMITVLVGAVMMPVPALIQRGVGAYLAECAMWLGALAAGAAVIGVGIPAALRVPAIADIVIAVLDPIPGIGTFIRTRRLSLLFGALGPALECGLPITEALELAANATGERSVRNRMAKIGPRLVAGEDLAQLLAEISGVNRETRARIASGVQSGRLADACMRLANEQAIAYRRAVEWMGTAIRLGLTLLITVLVGASIVRHMQQLLTAPLGGMGGDASELQRELMRALPSLGR